MQTNKLRVLQVIHGLRIGGAEKVVVDLATRIDRERFEMKVFSLNGRGVLADQLEAQGVEVLSPAPNSGLKELRAALREARPDLLHSHGTAALLHVGPLCLMGAAPPLVHTFHFGNYPHIRKRYLYAERLFARGATRLVAVAENQRRAVLRHHRVRPDRIETVFNGVDRNPFVDDAEFVRRKRAEFGYRDDDIVMGCIAVLSEQKGVDYLLDAADTLLAEEPRLRLFIAGGGRLLEPLERRAARLAHADRVHFAGWRSDALELLPMMDIFVMPSLWEAFSMVLLEAMAAKRPIVATEIADHPAIIRSGESGLLIPPRDADAIVAAVRRCLDDPAAARRMGERAHACYQQHLTVGNMVGNYERVYSEIAGQARDVRTIA